MTRTVPLFLGFYAFWSLGCSGNSTSPSPMTPSQPMEMPMPMTSPPTSPPGSPNPPPPSPQPPQGPQTLRTARFQGANGYRTSGGASIVRDGNAHRLELGDDFRTDNSAALDVRLCGNASCSGDDLNLGSLKRTSGAQSYNLPSSGDAYSHVVIWCRAVRLPFGFGELR